MFASARNLLTSDSKFPTCYATEQQVGNLSAHALQLARFKRKRLGSSKYSNLIFERFIGVFRSFFLLTKKLLIYCIVGNTRKAWERSEDKKMYKIATFA